MNNLSKGTWVMVGILTVFWIGIHLAKKESRRSSIASSAQHPGNEKALSSLEQELATLRHRLAQVESAQANVTRLHGRLTQLEGKQQDLQAEFDAVPPHDTRFPSKEKSDEATAEPGASEEARDQNLLALFETRFLQESDDPTWSRQAEASLTQAVKSAAVDGSRLLAAGCRTTLCHVEMSHGTEGDREAFSKNFPFVFSFDTEVFYHHLEDAQGTPYTVMYMSRTGHQLPMPAQ